MVISERLSDLPSFIEPGATPGPSSSGLGSFPTYTHHVEPWAAVCSPKEKHAHGKHLVKWQEGDKGEGYQRDQNYCKT